MYIPRSKTAKIPKRVGQPFVYHVRCSALHRPFVWSVAAKHAPGRRYTSFCRIPTRELRQENLTLLSPLAQNAQFEAALRQVMQFHVSGSPDPTYSKHVEFLLNLADSTLPTRGA
ncbi:bifunctionaluridylyltransferase/uridylyl-removing enzyme [Striga asiatica]|uniref:Bifunctionaluridylyltransferase/uridylyl-removing enzyme n=1 Tax=Striga asiatica TaxID=4170 RepID=A0A5A7RGJ5_STRAF|nr:bifunctionaluridylyltransferase/uridylyl-removing enzyme [Striga asiatica]